MANPQVYTGDQETPQCSSCTIEKQTVSTNEAESGKPNAIAQSDGRSRREEPESGSPSTSVQSQDQEQPDKCDVFRSLPSKRKRSHEVQPPSSPAQDPPPSKQPRKPAQSALEGQLEQAGQKFVTSAADPLVSWVLHEKWPKEYFEPDDQTREELLERDSWLEAVIGQPPAPVIRYMEIDGFRLPQPDRKTPVLRSQKRSDTSSNESTDRTKGQANSVHYRSARYATLLADKGSYLDESVPGITYTGECSCEALLNLDQPVPSDSVFRDDVFKATCRSVQGRNEARIVRSISPYIVPSAEEFAIMGATNLEHLIENVNEAWSHCMPVEGPRPQPDYSVGFRQSAFTEEQQSKLKPLIGTVFDTSVFAATYQMYFPFLTCEVKSGGVGLDIADRQNAHSMTIAVRSIVELYRAVKREKELDREILAFSISHNDRSVRIYGHYPTVDGDKIQYYRYLVSDFSLLQRGGRDKWTTYKFTKNVYDVWMPTHLKRICSAIDQLPSGLDSERFKASEASELSS